MYELSRVRLASVGPRGARFRDVTIDLSELGEPIAGQGRLLGPVRRRPAPASVLFLENGGGKTVLLKLIFSVMLPGRRQVMGAAGSLESFVLASDCGHVALEWVHVRSGDRVVVGKVYQWRDHTVSSDASRLQECWYSFRPDGTLELDSLPVARDGRLRTLAGFRESMHEARRANPAVELAWTQGHAEWTAHLESLGLDPELFRYQRAMNVDEGEAGEAFQFKKDEDFVDWLLTAVTDPQDPASLAESFQAYATTVGDRDAMVLERDFVGGALDLLRRLALAEGERAAARDLAGGVRAEGVRLSAAVAARHDADQARLAELAKALRAATAATEEAEAVRDRATSVVNEIRRRITLLEIEAAEADQRDVAEALADTRLRIDGWQACGLLLEHRAAAARVRELRDRVEAAERDAAPALRVRERAARALLRTLTAAEREARAEQARWERAAEAHGGRARKLHDHTVSESGHAREARGLARARLELAAAVAEELDEAARQGLLPAGAAAGDHAELARTAADQGRSAVVDARARLARCRSDHREADKQARCLDEEARAADMALDELRGGAGRLRGQATGIADDPRIPALLALDRASVDDLDAHAEQLERLLGEAVDQVEAQLRRLQGEADDDDRILAALGDGGLLPPRAEVEAALEVLAAAGVPAMSGWGYLAEAAAPAERQAALAAHPELADGVVLLSPDDLDRAEAALVGARLLPRAAVVAGASALLLAVGTERPQSFLVPPNPAMFDEEAADQERSRAQARQEARGERLAELSGRGRADTELLARLRVWRQACPPGQLAQLAGEVDTAAAKAVAAAKAAAEQRRRVDALAGEIDRLEQALLPALEQEAEAARDRAERLAALARREAERIVAQREAATLLARAEDHEAAAERARSAAEKEQELRGEALRAAESARSRAAALADEAAKVHGGTEPDRADGGDEEGGATPAPALPELRAQYQAAEEAYRMVAVGEDLFARLKAAEEHEGAARGRLASLAGPVREAATRLLASPEGSDAASREAARSTAERQEAALRRREKEITGRLGALGKELEHNRPTGQNVWVVLPEERTPHSVDQGRKLLAAAQDEQRASNDAVERARGRQERLDKEHGKLHIETRELGNVRKALSELLADVELPAVDDPAAAFPGSPEEAEARRASLRAALNEADTLLQQADQAVHKAGDGLVRFVGGERYEQLQSPARRQLLALGRDALAASANQWVDALAAREASLEQDLRELERHRRLIVERLAALCGSALATLHTAQRLSKLPHDLGDWSGQEFVRIRFADPEPGALTVRVAEVLDQAAAEASGQTPNRGATSRRDGIGLLLRAVRAAVPKGFAVDVLKPDAVLRTERVPVSRMASVFSGGQLLTAAIALYCMMAALRANERGQQRRSRHAGVLFLDNPIGRASASYLLELQMAVARALGVQLVYTTGLLDLTALSVFPLLIRLRNDADLRAGMRYIAVDQHVRRALPEPYADGEERVGAVSAVRLYRRPP